MACERLQSGARRVRTWPDLSTPAIAQGAANLGRIGVLILILALIAHGLAAGYLAISLLEGGQWLQERTHVT